jgi:hypothetical protein
MTDPSGRSESQGEPGPIALNYVGVETSIQSHHISVAAKGPKFEGDSGEKGAVKRSTFIGEQGRIQGKLGSNNAVACPAKMRALK